MRRICGHMRSDWAKRLSILGLALVKKWSLPCLFVFLILISIVMRSWPLLLRVVTTSRPLTCGSFLCYTFSQGQIQGAEAAWDRLHLFWWFTSITFVGVSRLRYLTSHLQVTILLNSYHNSHKSWRLRTTGGGDKKRNKIQSPNGYDISCKTLCDLLFFLNTHLVHPHFTTAI